MFLLNSNLKGSRGLPLLGLILSIYSIVQNVSEINLYCWLDIAFLVSANSHETYRSMQHAVTDHNMSLAGG